jgi:hypothetical protein
MVSRMTFLRASWGALATVGISCASVPAQSPQNKGYLASLKTIPPTLAPKAQVEPIKAGARASDYLALGLTHYNGSEKLQAIDAFHKALETGDLNNQGRALAYWHLFLSYRDEHLSSHGAEALESFITVSHLLLQQSDDGVDGEDLLEHVRTFIERFDLRDRLMLAEVTVEALWAHKDDGYGRTPQRPVLIGSARAQRLFVHVFKPCSEEQNENTKVRISKAAFTVNAQPVDEAKITCPGEDRVVSLFFSETR